MQTHICGYLCHSMHISLHCRTPLPRSGIDVPLSGLQADSKASAVSTTDLSSSTSSVVLASSDSLYPAPGAVVAASSNAETVLNPYPNNDAAQVRMSLPSHQPLQYSSGVLPAHILQNSVGRTSWPDPSGSFLASMLSSGSSMLSQLHPWQTNDSRLMLMLNRGGNPSAQLPPPISTLGTSLPYIHPGSVLHPSMFFTSPGLVMASTAAVDPAHFWHTNLAQPQVSQGHPFFPAPPIASAGIPELYFARHHHDSVPVHEPCFTAHPSSSAGTATGIRIAAPASDAPVAATPAFRFPSDGVNFPFPLYAHNTTQSQSGPAAATAPSMASEALANFVIPVVDDAADKTAERSVRQNEGIIHVEPLAHVNSASFSVPSNSHALAPGPLSSSTVTLNLNLDAAVSKPSSGHPAGNRPDLSAGSLLPRGLLAPPPSDLSSGISASDTDGAPTGVPPLARNSGALPAIANSSGVSTASPFRARRSSDNSVQSAAPEKSVSALQLPDAHESASNHLAVSQVYRAGARDQPSTAVTSVASDKHAVAATFAKSVDANLTDDVASQSNLALSTSSNATGVTADSETDITVTSTRDRSGHAGIIFQPAGDTQQDASEATHSRGVKRSRKAVAASIDPMVDSASESMMDDGHESHELHHDPPMSRDRSPSNGTVITAMSSVSDLSLDSHAADRAIVTGIRILFVSIPYSL